MRCCIKKMICTDGHSDHWGHWGHVLCNVSGFCGVLMTWGGIYLCWLLEVKMKTNWKIKWFCFFSTVFLSLLRGGWDVTKHKYFVTVPKYIFQVSVLYLRINFDFLLLSFSKQTRYISWTRLRGISYYFYYASLLVALPKLAPIMRGRRSETNSCKRH